MVNLNLILLTFCTFVLFANSKSLYECPDESNADILIASAWIDVPAKEHTSLVRRLRLPATGLLDDEISCFMATDTSLDDTGGDVEITAGGLGHRYVEVRCNSRIGKALDYVVLVYAANKVNKNITQTIGIIH